MVVFLATRLPASVFCLDTVPSSYFLDSSLATTLKPSPFLFRVFFASSSVIPTTFGTFTFVFSSVSTVSMPNPPLNMPAALPMANTRMNTIIIATTMVRIFITFFMRGFTSSELLPFFPFPPYSSSSSYSSYSSSSSSYSSNSTSSPYSSSSYSSNSSSSS